MLIERESNRLVIDDVSQLPAILALSAGGEPVRWITHEKGAYYKALDKVLWTMQGEYEVLLRGGTCAATGERTLMRIDTIIAVDNSVSPNKYRKGSPSLTNRDLFSRDRFLCAYCGYQFTKSKLTRDHIKPRARGGFDVWENVVTSCRPCNQRKDDRTPEQAHMQLLYVPYTPSYNEKLILMNRKILRDQMDFLIKGVGRNSRLLERIENGVLLK